MTASIRAATLILVAWASILLYVAGCGSGGGEGSTDPEPAGGPIELRSAGGYPPFTSTLRIDEDGSASLISQSFDEKQKTTLFEIPEDDLAEIRERLDEIDLGSLDVPTPGDCCDLVYYELTYGDDTVETDISTVSGELDQLITDISELKNLAGDGAKPGAGGLPAPR